MFLATVRAPPYALDVLPLGPQVPLRALNAGNYSLHFRNILIEERRALAEEFKEYNLYETQLEPVWKEGMYKISVPGLREYIPPIYVGDSVFIRAIRVGYGYGHPKGNCDGCEHVAFIWAIDRLKVYFED